MSLINIGELSKSFTEEYLALMPQIPWKAIRGFRNIASHRLRSTVDVNKVAGSS